MLKQFRTRLISLLLVVLMVAALFPLSTLTAFAASPQTFTATDGSSTATVSVSYTTATFSDGKFTIAPKESSGCTGTTYSSQSGTLTVTNGKSSTRQLSFNYGDISGTVKVNGVAVTAPGSYTIPKNTGSVQITITSGANQGENSTISLSNFVYSDPDAAYDVTISGAAHGSVTIGDHSVASGETYTAENIKNSTGVVISASPESGYSFFGLIDSNNQKQNQDSDGTYHPTSGISLTPVFARTDIDPVFSVDTYLYTVFNNAATKSASLSKPMIPVQDCILPEGNYTIPNKAILLIPFDEGGTLYKAVPEVIYNAYSTPTAFRTMEMADGANITVQNGGAISLGSKLSSKGQMGGYNGTPTGPDGRIYMRSGSNITLSDGANLYTWGYIYGSGDIEALSGSTVYEAFQIKDWRGGSATRDVVDYAFIFNQYYIQNIEVPIKIHSGASEKLYSSVNASGEAHPVGVDFIGKTNGMFRLTEGYLVKDYIEATDQVAYQMNGTASIAPLVISGVPIVGTVSTQEFILPLNGGMTIDVQSGKTTITQDLELLPGTTVSVQQNATVEIASGKKVYVYDADNWDNFSGTAKMYAVGYSVANGTAPIRTATNAPSASIDVNGTFNVKGSLYTSDGGADITSTIGTSGEHGKLVFTTAPSDSFTTIYECENNNTQTGVFMYPPKLHNGDDNYSETAGTGTSTWKYDKSGEHWYRYLVDFKYNDTLIDRGYYCENDDTVTYDASWLDNLGASASNGTTAVSGSNVNVTGVTTDSVVTLTGTPKEYIPTFVLNEKQYGIYQLYTGNTISETTTINDETYYIVRQADAPLAVGVEYDAPANVDMGVIPANQNTITWNMSGLSATSGDPYRGIVPAGDTPQKPVYIYGFYTGKVAHNKTTDTYYSTLIDAFADLNSDDTAEIELLADCGTFEEESGTTAYSIYPDNNITLDLNGHHAVGRILNQGTFTLELDGGTLEYHTGATAAATAYDGKAAVINDGVMTISDTTKSGKITADAIAKSSGFASYADVIRNNVGARLTVRDVTLEHKQTVSNYSLVLLNYGNAVVDNVTLTAVRGVGIGNSGDSSDLKIKDSKLSFTTKNAYYGVYNTASGTISEIDNCDLSTPNVNVIYNTDSATITSLKNTDITVSAPTTKNVYAVYNYGGHIELIDNCDISGNSGINNRNKRGSNTIAQGYNIAYYGTIGTIKDSRVNVGQYAVYNGGTINTMTGSTFTAAPASAQVPWPTGTAALNGNSVHAYTIVNSNLWWYDNAVWKRTDTTVMNGSTNMLQSRVSEYKTDDAYMPTIGTITDCTIEALNTSTSSSYGYYALQNLGVINAIDGSTTITSEKHPDNAKSVAGNYALRNESGGKIGSIGSGVSISAYNYAITNCGARYSETDVTYSTTYIDPETGALKSGGLATDYDYTYDDVSEIGSTGATVSATSQYAIVNYSKIGSVTGTLSANYNVIVNAAAVATTTSIESYTANSHVIEHRYFTNNDSSTTDNEIKREFEYTRNTTDGCYIGTIDATVTATGAGYQAINNQGYIGTLAGTVTTETGKATSSSTYYPLIYNGDQRQATLKQTEDYYVESNDYGATKYEREYKYVEGGPTINEITCTATNPQDYTIRNLGTVNTLSGEISGKTITVANEAAGHYQTRKTRTFYSSASRLAATKGSSEVDLEYTKQPAEIMHIDGATIDATAPTAADGKTALRNYGHIESISGSTITSSSTGTITNGSSTITKYTSNRADVLTGCVPTASACALAYDMNQTINEDEERVVGTIDTIGAGNYIQGTYYVLTNLGHIGTIDSGSGTTSIIYASSRQAIYNYDGNYSRRTNTSAVLTKATGTTTNNYTYEYVPAYIGTIKNVFILGKRQGILNGDGNATYNPVTIGEIGEGAEIRTSATSTYSACQNSSANAKIEKITGGVFITGNGSGIYGLKNDSTTYQIEITGGDFRGGNATRTLAISDADNPAKYTYPVGKALSDDTEKATYHTLSSKKLTSKTTDFYYIKAADVPEYTVTWKNGDTTLETDENVLQGAAPTFDGTTPTKDSTAQYTYTFVGWSTTKDSETGTAMADLPKVSADVTYYAAFSKAPRTYKIGFYEEGGKKIYEEQVAYGETPVYTGAEQTKAATAQYTYAFSGWKNYDTNEFGLKPVTEDARYQAQFEATLRKYTVTWESADGATLKTEQVAYGSTPRYTGATPTKASDAQYSYTFSGWSPAITSVTKDQTYTAQFDSTVNKYTITWVDGDGRTLKTDSVEYGKTPSYSGSTTPSKAPTAQYSYTFNNTWSPEIVPVTGNATYTAQFTQTTNTYTIQWVIDNGPSEAEVKAAVDAIIATHAQSIYDTVKVEMDFGWDMFGHANSIQMAMLDKYFGGGNTADTTYIANKIVSIVEQTTISDEMWNNTKETIVEKLLSSHDLLSEAERESLNALSGGKTILETDENVPYGTTPEYNGETPTKTGTDQYSYTFSGWTPEIAPVTGNATYTAQFTQTTNPYTIQWVIDESASEAEVKPAVDALIAEIAQSVYNDAKTEGDMIWNMGWMSHEELLKMHLEAGHVGSSESSAYIAKRIIEIVDNNSADFTAADALWGSCKDTIASDFAAFSGYTSSDTGTTYSGLTAAQKSSMEALSGGKTILETDENVPYGTTPEYNGKTPTKAGDAQYSYTFSGWTPEIAPVTDNVTYIAQFTQTVNEYTITWVDGDGNTLKTEQVAYGETPSYSGDTPTKAADDQYTYTFSNSWTPAITTVTGDATYTAQFTTETNRYTITWLDEDGTKIDEVSYAYGDMPTHVAPVKEPDDTYTYDFIGWTPEVVAVTENASYTAKYEKEPIFAGHLLTLGGDIGTQFFVNLNEQYDPANAVVEFSWNGQTKTVSLSDITPEKQHNANNEEITVYRATVNVAPKEMNDPITAVLKVNGETISTETYTAATYPRRVVEEYPDGDLRELCKAMLNYASKAQEQFDYGLEADQFGPARPIVIDGYTAPEVDTSKLVDYHTGNENFSSFGLSGYVGSTLQLNSKTTYALFFKISDKSVASALRSDGSSKSGPVTATIGTGDDMEQMMVSSYFVDDTLGNKDVYLRVDIEDIAAADITADINITFAGTQSFTVNTGAYINSALKNGDEYLRATVTALCDYNQKAIAFFKGN